ncbi:unnamed protein product [Zymoseptoria tritici ST99CH_3D7]|uniref:Uncharacterized protein n=1 Tax=Zymoseptoria tritici (strain ST99CH_3D7) TaxID=1276538 RepID=A0A1X7SA08_ZYMT9|nr:unnamed protein product [Zymoseptoria tritici ST99CH_3D7]
MHPHLAHITVRLTEHLPAMATLIRPTDSIQSNLRLAYNTKGRPAKERPTSLKKGRQTAPEKKRQMTVEEKRQMTAEKKRQMTAEKKRQMTVEKKRQTALEVERGVEGVGRQLAGPRQE